MEIDKLNRVKANRKNGRQKGKAKESRNSRRARFIVAGIVFLALALVATGFFFYQRSVSPNAFSKIAAKSPRTLAELLALKPAELGEVDIALMNMLCAEGLPGSENLNIRGHLDTLNQMAERVRSETLRNFHQFRDHPEEFENSEGYFRVLLLITVVQQDFNVRYNPALITDVNSPLPDAVFFADSKDLFLQGIASSRAMGTCVSMPVFYIAVGRRLGYPLKLVTAKEHLFARWESADGRERFNIEATGRGLSTPDDDYYRKWPFPMTEQEINAGQYLKSLTPADELAIFLETRGHCLERV